MFIRAIIVSCGVLAKLSELVEDVLISVRRKVKARLTRAGGSGQDPARARWVRELKAVQKAYSTGRTKTSLEAILADLRQDRM
jgi:hypothetical protein